MTQRTLRLPDGAGDWVTAIVHEPSRPRGPAFLLFHGAGGSYETPGLVALCEVIAGLGHLAVRANLPYREAGRGAPPKAELAVDGLTAIASAARAEVGPRRGWILGGKSYGGRVASLAVARGLPAAGLLFLGYPLHPPGKPGRVRVDHWPLLDLPALFLQGDRDPFCDLDLLRKHRGRWKGDLSLEVIRGGDHSLKVSRKASPDGAARNETAVIETLAPRIRSWIAAL